MKVPDLKKAIHDAEEALLDRMSYELLTVQPARRSRLARWRASKAKHTSVPAEAVIDGQTVDNAG
jgi:hypothetical protein